MVFNMTSLTNFSTYQKGASTSSPTTTLVPSTSIENNKEINHNNSISTFNINNDLEIMGINNAPVVQPQRKSSYVLGDIHIDSKNLFNNASIQQAPYSMQGQQPQHQQQPPSASRTSSPILSFMSTAPSEQELHSFSDMSDINSISEQTFEDTTTMKQRAKFFWAWSVHQAKTSTYHTWLRLALLVLIIVGVCLALFVFKLQHHLDVLQKFVDKFGVVVGGVVYVAIFVVLIIFLVPVTIPTILAGIIFGVWVGILLIWTASMLGGTIAFLLGRYVFRKSIVKRIENNKKLVAIDQAIGQEGWKIVLLLRLTPIVPESLLNYALAVTNVKMIHYLICSGIGLVPGVSFFIYLGSMIGNISDIGKARHVSKGEIAMYVVSAVAMVCTIVFITVIVRRAVNKKLDFEESKGILDEEAKLAHNDEEEFDSLEEFDDYEDQPSPSLVRQ
eukprot:gene7989-9384_t